MINCLRHNRCNDNIQYTGKMADSRVRIHCEIKIWPHRWSLSLHKDESEITAVLLALGQRKEPQSNPSILSGGV